MSTTQEAKVTQLMESIRTSVTHLERKCESQSMTTEQLTQLKGTLESALVSLFLAKNSVSKES